MKETPGAENRPYHHGDLRRALVDAARQLLERDGPNALSLRAVAREAGVSPAAPYHHFKDKSELLDAVAEQGWRLLSESVGATETGLVALRDRIAEVGLAYVSFAREHPALYRLMYDCSRNAAALPELASNQESAFAHVRERMIASGAVSTDPLGIELATIGSWCAAHGLAEMAGFKQFDAIKEAMGGEEAFLRGVLRHMGGVFSMVAGTTPCSDTPESTEADSPSGKSPAKAT
jgi:AcrR family transcriptional regulator